MDQCKRDGCGSYAINDHKESGLCDKCYWIEQAEKLTAERDKLKKSLTQLLKNDTTYESTLDKYEWALSKQQLDLITEALKESA